MLTAAGLIFSPALRPVRGEESAGPVDIDCTLLASCSSAVMKVRRVLILAAALLITAGVINGSARDVFYKAVRICTECIGLG